MEGLVRVKIENYNICSSVRKKASFPRVILGIHTCPGHSLTGRKASKCSVLVGNTVLIVSRQIVGSHVTSLHGKLFPDIIIWNYTSCIMSRSVFCTAYAHFSMPWITYFNSASVSGTCKRLVPNSK